MNITDILANVLAFVDDFDVEVVGKANNRVVSIQTNRPVTKGDPQTAVCHLGNVILFLQSTFVRYQVGISFASLYLL